MTEKCKVCRGIGHRTAMDATGRGAFNETCIYCNGTGITAHATPTDQEPSSPIDKIATIIRYKTRCGAVEALAAARFVINALIDTPADDRLAASIPDGWQLVPKHADDAMLLAAWKMWDAPGDRQHNVWMAMLAAAPQPPQNAADHIVDDTKKVSAVAYATAELDRVIPRASLADMPKSAKATYTVALGVIGGDAQSVRDAARVYPDDLTPELREVLGWPNFKCAPIAHLMVAAGAEIKPKSEDEQAAVLHWLVKLVFAHGKGWKEAASADIRSMQEVLKPAPPQTPVSDEVMP